MNETLTVFMISEIERLREEGREPARRIYHNMLRTLRESAGKEEIGFEEVTPVFLGKYEHWLLGKRLSWNTVSTYMRALRAGYNRGMKGRPGYVTGLFDKVYTGTRSDVKRAVDARTVGRMIRMSGCPDESASAKAVDWFVLMFMLRGLPFVDLAHLRRSNLDKGVLTYCRHKTGQEVSITVPREAMDIINRRMAENDHPSYLLPILGQPRTGKRRQEKVLTPYQEYQCELRNLNRRLERVSVDLRLGGRLSSYTARHTWATIAFHQETPVGVISRGLGHSSVKVTETYLKPFGDREVDRTNRKILNYVLNAV